MSSETLGAAVFTGGLLIAFGLLPGAAVREVKEKFMDDMIRWRSGLQPFRTHWEFERDEPWPPPDRVLFAVVGAGLILLCLFAYFRGR
ncbi:MAG: hypothetical protein LAQ30_02490 [Acidobacteriia bacterium]|nr:hypothetical protein [Terriglobia bacterium]